MCVHVCVYLFSILFYTSSPLLQLLLLLILLLLDSGTVAQLETWKTETGGNSGVNRGRLDSLPCVHTAWTVALGKKRQLIIDKPLFLPSANSPTPSPSLSASLPPSPFLFSFFDSVSFHSLWTVFLCSEGGRRFAPGELGVDYKAVMNVAISNC